MRRVLTTVFFPDHPAEKTADPVLTLLPEPLRERLLAVPDNTEDGVRVFRFDLRLRGGPEEETPFFEDCSDASSGNLRRHVPGPEAVRRLRGQRSVRVAADPLRATAATGVSGQGTAFWVISPTEEDIEEGRFRLAGGRGGRMKEGRGMRTVVLGAGAIGGWLAAGLARAGNEVGPLARGASLAAPRADGLVLHEGDRRESFRVTATDDPAALTGPDLLVLGFKAQDLPELCR